MKTTTTIIALAAASSVALADGGDYGLAIEDGKVVVGVGDHDEGTISDFGERVFLADMFLSGPNYFADEPGIFIAEASLPDNTQVGFNIIGSLQYWDGTGAVSFSQSANTMTLGFGPQSRTTSTDGSDVAGFSVNYDADFAGGFDEHYDYLIDGSAADGIYLLTNTFTLSGAEDSVTIFTLFNVGLSEELHNAAGDYAENVLVPAPGAMALLGLGGLAATRRRRR
jgi:uncharacterized protein (TIGR03382 family)